MYTYVSPSFIIAHFYCSDLDDIGKPVPGPRQINVGQPKGQQVSVLAKKLDAKLGVSWLEFRIFIQFNTYIFLFHLTPTFSYFILTTFHDE